jgi:hypothetical protein
MSIDPQRLLSVIALAAAILLLWVNGTAQTQGVRVKINASQGLSAKVSGSFREPVQTFSFETARAGANDLERRVSSIELKDEQGETVPFRRGLEGGVRADRPVSSFNYKVSLEAPVDPAQAAHISWVSGNRGLLMTGDLLPRSGDAASSVEIRMELPQGWQARTSVEPDRNGVYRISRFEDAVFLIGSDLRFPAAVAKGLELSLAVEGEWQFDDAEAARMAEEIIAYYSKMFGAVPFSRVTIDLVRVPDENAVDRWSAETRGNTVVIASSPSRYRNLGPQRLHEQLRHELLHLWIPNSLNLIGDYAWFYEGFIIYEALKAGVRIGRIRFVDYLNTIAQAYRNTAGSPGHRKTVQSSLSSLGFARWEGSGGLLYSKGLLVAFLCDAAMMDASGGDRESEDLLREFYRKAAAADAPRPGTELGLEVIGLHRELSFIAENYITGDSVPDWSSALQSAGLTSTADGFSWKLAVQKDPGKRQKAILKRLGYNVSR